LRCRALARVEGAVSTVFEALEYGCPHRRSGMLLRSRDAVGVRIPTHHCRRSPERRLSFDEICRDGEDPCPQFNVGHIVRECRLPVMIDLLMASTLRAQGLPPFRRGRRSAPRVEVAARRSVLKCVSKTMPTVKSRCPVLKRTLCGLRAAALQSAVNPIGVPCSKRWRCTWPWRRTDFHHSLSGVDHRDPTPCRPPDTLYAATPNCRRVQHGQSPFPGRLAGAGMMSVGCRGCCR